MNIQVLFTGGTIGASVQGDYIRTDERAPYMLLSMYQKSQTKLGNADCLPTFHTKTPYTLLSENLTGNTLNQLISSLSESITNNYDGIIVTHGTDTLQYSAAALSILFETCNIPIVLVSSNYILDDPRANGLVNFSHAVDFIQQSSGKKQGGVFVSYCNKGENPHIYPATSLLAHDAYDDKIKCVPDNLSQTDAVKKMICNEKLLLETSAKTVAFKEPCPVVYIKAMP